ncbi:MAG: metallophosphoesterase [Acidobacteria bacterium]|nr:metallophosphoesterase [Acidobacteriota bacterium]
MRVRHSARITPWWTGVVTWLLLIWVSVAGVAAAQPERVVAIGDIHGAVAQFRRLLETVGLTDSSQRWTGGRTTLVQTGDFMDRGAGVKAVLDLLMRLETEASAAGGRVVVLLGNHETMNLMGNVRDTTRELLASFATPRSTARREEAYEAYLALLADRAAVLGPLASDPLPRTEWMKAHPPGFFEYMDAFGPDGTYGHWLRAKPVVARVGDSILLHGGLHPTKAPTDLAEINARARREIETYDRLRERLIEHGIILPFYTFEETTAAVQRELDAWAVRLTPTGPPAPDAEVTLTSKEREHIELLLAMGDLRTWSLIDEDGPVWFRGFARWDDDEGLPQARSLTERYGVARIVVGHTIPATRLITPRFGNRVFLIDTGMLVGYYTGRPSALEIEGSRVTAVYLDRRETLVDTPQP